MADKKSKSNGVHADVHLCGEFLVSFGSVAQLTQTQLAELEKCCTVDPYTIGAVVLGQIKKACEKNRLDAA